MELSNTRRIVLDALAAGCGGPKRAFFKDDGSPEGGPGGGAGSDGSEGGDAPPDPPAQPQQAQPPAQPQQTPTPAQPQVPPPAQPAPPASEGLAPSQEPPPATFTQTDVDAIIQERLARERRQREEELQGKVVLSSQDADDLEQLRAERREREAEVARRREQEAIEKGETAKVLEEKERRINELSKEVQDTKIQERQLRMEDKRVGRRDAAIARLVDSGVLYGSAQKDVENTFNAAVSIDHDTEEVYVVDDDGTPMTESATGRRLTVAEGLQQWLDRRPYFVTAPQQQRGGSGTPPAAGSTSTGAKPTPVGGPEVINGKAPIVGADGKLYFSRSMLRLPGGLTDGDFMEKYRNDVQKAQEDGRYWDDLQGHPPPPAVAHMA